MENGLLTWAQEQQTPVDNIQTSCPLQLVMINYLTMEESLRGYKYLLVMVDHITKLAVAVPTWDQTAETDSGRSSHSFEVSSPVAFRPTSLFEGKVIEKLCWLYQIRKTELNPPPRFG